MGSPNSICRRTIAAAANKRESDISSQTKAQCESLHKKKLSSEFSRVIEKRRSEAKLWRQQDTAQTGYGSPSDSLPCGHNVAHFYCVL